MASQKISMLVCRTIESRNAVPSSRRLLTFVPWCFCVCATNTTKLKAKNTRTRTRGRVPPPYSGLRTSQPRATGTPVPSRHATLSSMSPQELLRTESQRSMAGVMNTRIRIVVPIFPALKKSSVVFSSSFFSGIVSPGPLPPL